MKDLSTQKFSKLNFLEMKQCGKFRSILILSRWSAKTELSLTIHSSFQMWLTDSSSGSSLRHPTWESQLLHSREKFKKEKAIYLCLKDSCEKWVEQKDSWVKYYFPLSQQHILLQKFSFWTLCNFLYFPGDCLKFQWWYCFPEIFSPFYFLMTKIK